MVAMVQCVEHHKRMRAPAMATTSPGPSIASAIGLYDIHGPRRWIAIAVVVLVIGAVLTGVSIAVLSTINRSPAQVAAVPRRPQRVLSLPPGVKSNKRNQWLLNRPKKIAQTIRLARQQQ
jgi:hypothetical protein